MHFLREQFKYALMFWLLISLAAAFIFSWFLNSVAAGLIKVFTTSKTFAVLTCINTDLRCIKDCELL